jgi:hypothetical protein
MKVTYSQIRFVQPPEPEPVPAQVPVPVTKEVSRGNPKVKIISKYTAQDYENILYIFLWTLFIVMIIRD